MKKKLYSTPQVENLLYITQSLMKIGSDLPDDPSATPAPARRTEVF